MQLEDMKEEIKRFITELLSVKAFKTNWTIAIILLKASSLFTRT